MSGDLISGKTFEHNITDKKNMNPATGLSNMLDMLFNAGLKRKDITKFIVKMQDWYKADLPGRLKLTAGKTFGEFLDYPSIPIIGQKILNSFIGIIVAARVECDAYVIMSMFEALGFFTSPKSVPWIKNSGVAPKNMFRGPSSVYFIQPLVNYLCDNGVKFYFNTEITGVYSPTTSPTSTLPKIDINTLYKDNDVLAICTPHMITAGFIPDHLPAHILHNEWSFGLQYYVTDLDQLNDKLIPQRKDQAMYRSVIGAPWQIVYVIEYSIKGMTALKKRLGRDDLIDFWNMNFGEVHSRINPCNYYFNYIKSISNWSIDWKNFFTLYSKRVVIRKSYSNRNS